MKVERHTLAYEDRASNSDKFYQAYITDRGVMLRFGRKGSTGQHKWHPTRDRNEAEVFARKKLFEKLDKGYYETGQADIFEVEDWGPREPRVDELWSPASGTSRKANPLTQMSGDLATQAEEFADKVTTVITAVRQGMTTPSELLTSISELDASLARAKAAIENAELGLEMARRAVGQRLGS